jgi:hypothetical protein
MKKYYGHMHRNLLKRERGGERKFLNQYAHKEKLFLLVKM